VFSTPHFVVLHTPDVEDGHGVFPIFEVINYRGVGEETQYLFERHRKTVKP
jgi:hypothetical protein